MFKAPLIRRLLQGNDDLTAPAPNATAVSNSDSIVWFDGGVGFAGVTEMTAPTTAPIIQIHQTQPVAIDNMAGAGNAADLSLSGLTQTGPQIDTSAPVTVGAGATREIAGTDSGSVTFAASTGMLKLDNPTTFSGEIFNFTGNGALSGSDQIDLTNINFNSVKDSYANGVLTVTDGTHTDKLNLNGSYTLANFSFASDGSGGTIVYDPPTTYYVSSEIGSNNNAGTSATAPLASLQAAEALVKPGDTVEVMNGTYTGNAPGGGDVLDITTSGTASAPITFEAAPGQTPVINSSGGWNAINIEGASYIVISGFTVVGDAANYTLAQALAGYGSGNANLDGNGIAVTSPGNGVDSNHITLENNTVYDEPGAGIYTQGTDYLQVLNNVVYDNAYWSAYGTSGISIGISANSNTNAGVHDIISGNLVYGNANLVPTTGGNTITDGEGIILDTNPGFVGEILVENNTVYGNGSSGIESFLTNNAVITNNTVYGNDTGNVQAASNAEIFINQSNNDTVTGNTTTAPNLTPPAAPVISGDTVGFDDTVTLNGTAEAGSTVTVFDKSTQLGTAVTNASGAWMFTTGALANGSQSFTATATDSVGNVSPLSSALVMTLNAPVNLVANGNFATGDFTDWTLGGNYTATSVGPEIYIDTNAEGGSTAAAGMGSMGADGTLSQTIATTAGQTYTLSFWLQNEESGTNDFKAIWNGQTLLSLTNAAQSGYTEYTYSVTATSSQTTLEFSAANGPSQWDLDNISLTANGTGSSPPPPPAAPVISTGVTNSNETVTLTGTATAGSTVTVSDGGATALGTTTATGGSWSFTTAAALAAGSYAFTATDTTSAGTSAASSPFDVTVTAPPPAAPVIKTAVVNANTDPTVTLTGTAPDGATVTMSDGGSTALGTTTASTSNGAWTFTTADLAAGSYAFTATDTTSAGTSTTSAPIDVTVPPAPAAPVISTGMANSNETVTLTGTATAGSTVTVSDGGATALGTTTATGGSWSFTTAAALAAGSYAFTATDTTSAGTSAASSPFDVTVTPPPPPAAPVIGTGVANSNESVTLTGSAPAGSTVTVSDGGATALGTTASTSNGAWTFTTADLAAGSYAFTATDTTSAGTSAKSSAVDVTVPPAPAAPVISTGMANSNETVTLTGTATAGSTVTVSDGGATALGTTTATGGSWSFTTAAALAAGSYAFTATDTTSAGTSAASSPFDVTVTPPPPPAAPVIGTGVANSNESVTLTGSAPAGSTVTVSDGGATALGTTASTSNGAWTFTTADLAAGSYAFTATDTTSAGTSAKSSAVDVTVSGSSPPPTSNLITNGSFATDSFSGWTRAGNYTSKSVGPEIYIDTNAEGGSTYAAGMGSMGADGTLSQTIATTAGQTYTLSFWLQNEESGTNDFKAIWNGQTLLSLTNAAQSGYTEYTYTVTATSSTTTLEFSAANGPSQWDLDNISLTANGTGSSPPPSGPAVSSIVVSPSSGALGAGQTVTLTLDMSKNVTINTASGKPTLTLNDGGTATYKSGSGTGALIFTYKVAAGQNTPDLSVTKVNLNGATIQDGTGNAANLSLIGLTQTGPQIDTSAPVTVGAGAKLEIAGTDTGSVTFAASTGMLKLDTPSTFSGKIFNFTGNGTLSGSDQIDLTNINFNTVKDRYANGVLTVMDGTHTDKLTLNGSYTLANFSFASDGSGGTIVYDPPVSMPSSQDPPNATSTGPSGPPSIGTGKTLELTASDPGGAAFTGSAGTLILDGFAPAGHALDFTGPVTGFGERNVIDLPGIAFDAQTTLGYSANNNQTGGTLSLADGTHSVNIALLGNYLASCFATESDNHGDTMVVADASRPSDQSQLSNPHHT